MLRQRIRRYSYLESKKEYMIHKLSNTLRQNHTGFDITENLDIPNENGTTVEWIRTTMVKGEQ